MFELTDDGAILTNNRTCITVMCIPEDTVETISERLNKYFPKPEQITEEYCLETMLMVYDPDKQSRLGAPLQSLYLRPSVNDEGKDIISLLMYKRDCTGKVVHTDTDALIVGSDHIDANIKELINNFVDYHLFVVDIFSKCGENA